MSGTAADRTPLVTVGLPVYNGQRYLAGAIEALLAQSYRDFILIISDNASTDETADICRRYAGRDARIRYHRNEANIGLSANFNRVFTLSSTRYFKWATADDYVSADMLSDAIAVLEADPDIALCYPRTTLVDEVAGTERKYEDRLHLMQEDAADRFIAFLDNVGLSHQHQGVIRAEAIRRTAMLRDHLASDVNFLAELTLYGKFYEVPRYQLFRRFHPDSSSWARNSGVHQAKRYHASGVRRTTFNAWKTHLALVGAALRSPCVTRQKLRLLATIGRRMYWDKGRLCTEVVHDAFGRAPLG